MLKGREKIISFKDAERLSGPLAFNVMVKPAGSLCNLDCAYCYYLDKSRFYESGTSVMTVELLERVIADAICSNEVDEVTFEWHGGEPLTAGMAFYEKALEFQQKYAEGKKIHNSIQTNGTLITPRWAEFLGRNDFLVGISIDGPKDLHDSFRCDRGGHSSFDRVMTGLMFLHQAGVQFNTMTTVNKVSEGRGKDVYQFLRHIGSRYMQFMPVLEYVRYPEGMQPEIPGRSVIANPSEDGAVLAPWSVSAEGFGRFMCDIFDEWVRADVGKCFVNLFDATLALWCGVQPGICVYAETCGGNLVVEHNGDVYSCDHFVYEKHRLGNIGTESFATMARSQAQVQFGLDKRNALPPECRRCEVGFLCHGECPKHRFALSEDGKPGLNSLCEGYRLFYAHTEPYMQEMKRLLLAGRPPAEIMEKPLLK